MIQGEHYKLALNTEQTRNLATKHRTEPPHSSLGYSFLKEFVEPLTDSQEDTAATPTA